MDRRRIPGTDIQVSKICLGTMNWGQQCTQTDAFSQLDYATDRGVNFIDTAEIYPVPPDRTKQGLTEEFIGNWLHDRGKRDDIIIATKVVSTNMLRTRPLRGEVTQYDRVNIAEAIDGSLRRLRTDYVDLYQVHWPERDVNMFGVRGFESIQDDGTPIEETLSALSDVVQSGKVRYIGVCNETPWGLTEYLRLSRESGLPKVVTLQNQYSLLNRTLEIGLSEICVRENVGVLAYSPLSAGVLSGKYLGGAYPPGARHSLFERNRPRYNAPHHQEAIAAYVEVARTHGLDPAQMALSFVLGRPFMTAALVGATSMEQLRTDIDSAQLHLSDDVMKDIASVYKRLPDPQC